MSNYNIQWLLIRSLWIIQNLTLSHQTGSQMTFSKVEMCSIDLGQSGANILYLVGINCGTVVETRFPYARFLHKVSLSLEIATHLHPPGLQHTCLHQHWSSLCGFCRICHYRCSTCIVPEPKFNWLVEFIYCNCLHLPKSVSKIS